MGKPALKVTTYDSAAAFRERVEPFLMGREAVNNLILGLTSGLIGKTLPVAEAPFFASVETEGEVVATAMRTPPYRLIVSSSDELAALELIASALDEAGEELPGVTGPVAEAEAFAEFWQDRTDVSAERVRSLRIFELRRVKPVSSVAGSLRRATAADFERVIDWFVAFAIEADTDGDRDRLRQAVESRLASQQGGIWLWELNGVPVSMVGAGGLTPHGIRIGPVYTPPEQRRAGYASAATAAVSQLLLDGGRELVFLFTDQANPTANHIYQAIGYEPVGETVEIEFSAPA